MRSLTLISCGAALAFAATTASAETFEKYGEVEGWKVFVDVEKNSCLIEKIDDLENVVQMGLTADKSAAYVGVFTKGETTVKKDEKEAVAIAIGENVYLGEATGMRGNITKGYSGGYVLADDPQFIEDIARQYEMVVFPEKEFAFVVDLTGTLKAIEMVKTCIDER
ncbi:hypothetical protein SuNHUV7_32330 (plasmid) [Pseudoseohaeicola sp. NH-UV-7]|jgi:hypothetical protein|uniref:hypothetical protein n=1 Tax=Sulfitobacter sp. TBRI5 TaxID=2989732 RepID=UPI003A716768